MPRARRTPPRGDRLLTIRETAARLCVDRKGFHQRYASRFLLLVRGRVTIQSRLGGRPTFKYRQSALDAHIEHDLATGAYERTTSGGVA